MKIAIFRAFPSPLRFGNYNVQELGLAKSFFALGISSDLYSFIDGISEPVSILKDSNAEIRIIPLRGVSVLKRFSFVFGIRRMLRMGNYDVIQVHEYNQLANYSVLKEAKRNNAITVLYQGVYQDFGGFGKVFNLFYDYFLLGRITKMVNFALAKTTFSQRYLLSKSFEDVSVLPVGLDFDPFEKDCDDKRIVNFTKNFKYVLLYVGIIEPRRDLFFALSVLKLLNTRFGENAYGFLIVGDGPDVSKVSSRVTTLGLDKCILRINSLPNTQMSSVYKFVDLLLLPSHYEIYGMVVLEALYFGLPVISSITAGPSDILTKRAYGLVLKFDIEVWCQGISDYLVSKYMTNSYFKVRNEYVKDKFCWKIIGEQYLGNIKSVKN